MDTQGLKSRYIPHNMARVAQWIGLVKYWCSVIFMYSANAILSASEPIRHLALVPLWKDDVDI